MKPLTTLLISGEWRRTYYRLWNKERKGQQSEVTKRTMRRNAPKNSLNEFISRERKRKNIPWRKQDPKQSCTVYLHECQKFARDSTAMKTSPTSKCLSRSIQKHLVAFLYYQRGTKRATVCYCTQSEGPLLLNLMKWNWKVQFKIKHLSTQAQQWSLSQKENRRNPTSQRKNQGKTSQDHGMIQEKRKTTGQHKVIHPDD